MSFSLSRTQLNQERQAAMPSQGWHQGRISKITTASKPHGNVLIIVFQLETGQEVVLSVLIEPTRHDLLSMSNAQKALLLDLIQAGIGVDEVPDVGAALQGMLNQGTQVHIEVKHAQKNGRTYANVAAFAAIQQAGVQPVAPAGTQPGQGTVAAPMPGQHQGAQLPQGTAVPQQPQPQQPQVQSQAAPTQSDAQAWNMPPPPTE